MKIVKNILLSVFILSVLGAFTYVITSSMRLVNKYMKHPKYGKYFKELHKKARYKFALLFEQWQKAGFDIVVTSGFRDWGANYSYHKVGLALDVNLIKNGKQYTMNTSVSEWRNSGAVAIAENLGFRWGGTFLLDGKPDTVHFDLQPIYDSKKSIEKAELKGKELNKGKLVKA